MVNDDQRAYVSTPTWATLQSSFESFCKVDHLGVLTYARWSSLSRGSEIAQFMLATLFDSGTMCDVCVVTLLGHKITKRASHIDRFDSGSVCELKFMLPKRRFWKTKQQVGRVF